MKLEVVLVLAVACSLKGCETKYLVVKREDGQYELPTRTVGEQESTLEVASKMLKDITSLEAKILGVGWVHLTQGPLSDAVNRVQPERVIAVPYGALVPGELFDIKKPAEWRSLIQILTEGLYLDHLDILTVMSNII